jgi:hypothetical protein
METKNAKAKKLIQTLETTDRNVFIGTKYNNVKDDLYDFTIETYTSTHQNNAAANPESKLDLASIRPYGAWFENKFGDTHIQHVSYQGIFSVDIRNIRQHPKSYYEDLIKELETSSNPEVGHYFERSWAAVFKATPDVYQE